MGLTPSKKPTREWLLLAGAMILVAAVAVPLWHWSGRGADETDFWSRFTAERLGRLLLGPEQIACYVCTVWAGFIILSRFAEVRRQRRAFDFDILPTEEGARLLPEDARPLIRKIDQVTARRGPTILATMTRMALSKFAVSGSATEASEVVRTQAEVEQNRMAASITTVHYLAWAIPALGFLGTVRGLAGGMSLAGLQDSDTQRFLDTATRQLAVAFDTTFVALALSLIVMYFLHAIQRAEEALVLDCQQYCQEHLVLRLYNPNAEMLEPAEQFR
jgi:biopolymer transport protein ExbB/TolQ